MVRAFRWSFLLGCGFALLTTPAAAANTTKPKVPAPLGFDIYGAEFAFVSNDGWDLVDGSAAKEVRTYVKKSPGATDALNRQDRMYIWAKTCTPAAQKVVFERTYDMPGVPTSFSGTLWATNSGLPQGPSQPIVDVKVFINGQLLVNANGSKVADDSAGFVIPTKPNDAKLFRKGNNQIRIEVNKRAQSGFNNKCMYNTTPLGLRFALTGRFSTDLFLSPSSTPQNRYFAFYSLKATLNVSKILDFRNRGPADANFARMTVVLGGQYVSFIDVQGLMNSTGPCEQAKRAIAEWVMDIACGHNEIDVGGQDGPNFQANYYFNDPPQYAILYMNATLSSRLDDPMFDNNQVQLRMHLCGPGAYHFIPECPVYDLPAAAAPSEKAELLIQ
jgi:hypothetical protein